MNAKGLVLFGVGGFAEVAKYYFEQDAGRKVVAFTVDGTLLRESTFAGCPTVAFEELASVFRPEAHDLYVAVGYVKRNAIRTERSAAAKALGYSLAGYTSSKANLPVGFTPREHCFIADGAIVQPFARVGSNVIIWSGALIGHHSIVEDNVFVGVNAVICGRARIGANTFLGANSTVRVDARVGLRCIVGAGVVITADTQDASVHVAPATPTAS